MFQTGKIFSVIGQAGNVLFYYLELGRFFVSLWPMFVSPGDRVSTIEMSLHTVLIKKEERKSLVAEYFCRL